MSDLDVIFGTIVTLMLNSFCCLCLCNGTFHLEKFLTYILMQTNVKQTRIGVLETSLMYFPMRYFCISHFASKPVKVY